MNTKEMAQDLSKKIPYELSDDRILVKPLKPVYVTKEVPIPPKQDSLDTVEATEAKVEKKKVLANVQKGVILKLGPDYKDMDVPARMRAYEVGDIVMFPAYAGQKFELFKDSLIFRRYEILGKVIE